MPPHTGHRIVATSSGSDASEIVNSIPTLAVATRLGPDREEPVSPDVTALDARDAASERLADRLLVDVVEVEPP
jgi:hypothetical protein